MHARRGPRYAGLSLPNVLLEYIPRPGSPPTVSIQPKRLDCNKSIMETQASLVDGRVLLFSSLEGALPRDPRMPPVGARSRAGVHARIARERVPARDRYKGERPTTKPLQVYPLKRTSGRPRTSTSKANRLPAWGCSLSCCSDRPIEAEVT